MCLPLRYVGDSGLGKEEDRQGQPSQKYFANWNATLSYCDLLLWYLEFLSTLVTVSLFSSSRILIIGVHQDIYLAILSLFQNYPLT